MVAGLWFIVVRFGFFSGYKLFCKNTTKCNYSIQQLETKTRNEPLIYSAAALQQHEQKQFFVRNQPDKAFGYQGANQIKSSTPPTLNSTWALAICRDTSPPGAKLLGSSSQLAGESNTDQHRKNVENQMKYTGPMASGTAKGGKQRIGNRFDFAPNMMLLLMVRVSVPD